MMINILVFVLLSICTPCFTKIFYIATNRNDQDELPILDAFNAPNGIEINGDFFHGNILSALFWKG